MNLLKYTFTMLVSLLLSLASISQDWCATHTRAEQAIANNPALKQQLDAIWDMPAPQIEASSNKRGRTATYIIPVVFHVVHDNGVGDIPYDQLESAIEVLNEDFRRTNFDTSNTRPVFQPFAVDSDIEFRIARVDPNGDCTNGVVRINDPSNTYDARDNVKGVSYWPSNRYLNIWVVNSIRNFSGGAGIVLGYAQFPGFGSWNTYGIVCRNDRLGKFGIGTSVSDGRTLTHEVGHCLNLLHTFQSGCGSTCNASGDRVCDTPPAFEATYNCNTNQNTCSNDASGSASVFGGDVVDQIENYMSYDDCQNMFSAGQRDRMHGVLTGIPELVNLVSTSNLQATGVLNPQDVLCKADFRVSSRVVCVGQAVSFTDLSYFNPTEHKWEFEKGVPAVSTNQNPTVVFTESGLFDVTLTIKNGTDSVTSTQTEYIRVLPFPGTVAPFLESFEFGSGGSLEDNDWYAEDQNDAIYGWQYSSEAYTGNNSLVMFQFNEDGRTTGINSPAYNLAGLETATVSFYTAYAQRSSSDFDILRVYFSTNCGDNWSIGYATGGPNLASLPITTSPLQNLSPSDWKQHTFNLPAAALEDQVRFRFEVFSDNGNFIFLDDINITGDLSDIPVLLEPLDASTSAATDEKLDWKATSSADQYEVWIDVDPAFNTPSLQTEFIDYLSSNSNGIDSEWTPGNLLVNETYYWRVRTVVAGTASTWSETWSFTVTEDNAGDPTGIEEKTTNSWQIFPNPANEVVNVVPNFDGEASVTISNIQGQVVYQTYTTVNSNSAIRIETSRLTAGLYILSLESTVGRTVQEKVLIQH